MSRIIESKVLINAPIKKVYSTITDIDSMEHWTGAVDVVKTTYGKVQVGSKFIEIYKYRAREAKSECVVTSIYENENFAYSTQLGSYKAEVSFNLSSNGDDTLVNTTIKLETSNLFKLSMMFHIVNEFFTRRQLDRNMQKLKQYTEDDI